MAVDGACVRPRRRRVVARLKAEESLRILMAPPSRNGHRDGL